MNLVSTIEAASKEYKENKTLEVNPDYVDDAKNEAQVGKKGLTKHKGKHDKDKPWDDPSIDHWKIEKFDPSWNESGLLDVSSFSTIFPQYREKYLQDVWPTVKAALREHGISCELNLVEGTMTVSTTRKTRDPYIIVKSRDLIKLLSRSVPAPQAIKILDDEMQCDIIKIGNLVRNKARFVKRRQHLLGPNNSTLKALEILTGCYILVQGNTVAAMGSFKGLKQVRRIVEDCIQNKMHPIYHIKILMMKRELAKDPALATENWERFLPQFKKKNVQKKKGKGKEKKPYTPFPPPQQPSKILMMKRELAKDPALATENWERFLPQFKKKNVQKKKGKGKEKKPYTPFPPPQQPSKIDQQLETGEYFWSEEKKSTKMRQEKEEKQAEKTAENKRKREAAFIPPEELVMQGHNSATDDKGDVSSMALSLKQKSKEFKKQKSANHVDPQAYIAEAPAKKIKSSKS